MAKSIEHARLEWHVTLHHAYSLEGLVGSCRSISRLDRHKSMTLQCHLPICRHGDHIHF